MKNLFVYLLFCCTFLLGIVQMANAQCCENAVTEAECHFKTGAVYSFEIPDKYINKDEKLSQPMEIRIVKTDKMPVYSTQSMDLTIEIPKNLTGDYILSISIGKYQAAQEIKL